MKNWFTSKPHWLKGGIVGVIISSILSFLYFMCLVSIEAEASLVCLFSFWPGVILYFRFMDFFYQFGETIYLISIVIPHLIIWTTVGVLVGWVVGRVKSKAT